jgi:hypothetical protein
MGEINMINMKRAIGVITCLLVIAGLSDNALAALSGFYRCTATVGSLDDIGTIDFEIVTYNPNATPQIIQRVGVRDRRGNLFSDSGSINLTVPPRGSLVYFPPVPEGFNDIQVVVSWSQSVDTAGPIPRMNIYLFNDTGAITSVARTGCP